MHLFKRKALLSIYILLLSLSILSAQNCIPDTAGLSAFLGTITFNENAPLAFEVPNGNSTFAVLHGTIENNTPQTIDNFIASFPNVTTLVFMQIPGSGDDDANLIAAQKLRNRGYLNYLPAVNAYPDDAFIASGGVDMFISGVSRVIDVGAEIGVHAWSNGVNEATDFPMNDPVHQPYIDYYVSMGMTQQEAQDFYFFTINAAPANDIYNMTEAEIVQYKLRLCATACPDIQVQAPAVTQPTCNNGGTIIVNATAQTTLEYSINNGTNWTLNNTFAGLQPMNYIILVRPQGNANCQVAYTMNPVTLDPPQNCGNCQTFMANDVPINIPNGTTMITSTINVPVNGTITDVNIRNLNGTHTWVNDLIFTLMSPQGTEVTLIENQCANEVEDFNISLDDEAGNDLTCPISAGNTQKPMNPLEAFDGENANGNWVLTITDVFTQDDPGILNGWSIEVCGNFQNVDCPNNLSVDQNPITTGMHQANIQLTSKGTVVNGTNVTFRAGNNVELQADAINQFTVQSGGQFEIQIGGCN